MEPGKYVKIVFRNSTQVEGTVESWSDTKSILVSADGMSRFIIFKTNEDILGVKVYSNSPVTKIQQPSLELQEAAKQFKEAQSTPSADDLRLHSLAHLKSLMNEQEKKIISDKVRSHSASNVRLSQYGLPNFITK